MRKLLFGCLVALAASWSEAQEAGEPRLIFVSRRSEENLLYAARPDGSDPRPIFGGVLKDVPGVGSETTIRREPHWCRLSPDRRFFLDWAADIGFPFDKYKPSPHFLTYLGRVDGGAPRVLLPDADEIFAWSPDSRRIAFAVHLPSSPHGVGIEGRASMSKISVIGVDGSDETLVLERPGIWHPLDWTPDGKKILFLHMTGTSFKTEYSGLVELDLEAMQRRLAELAKREPTFGLNYPMMRASDLHLRSITGQAHVSDGRYSPDGKSVACIFAAEGDSIPPKSELGLLDLATRKIRPIQKAPGLRGPICWSADGREILFSRTLDAQHMNAETVDGGPGLGIYAVSAQGGEARYVTSGWSPDIR